MLPMNSKEYMNGWTDGVTEAITSPNNKRKLSIDEHHLNYIEGYHAGRNAHKRAEMWSKAKEDGLTYLVGI